MAILDRRVVGVIGTAAARRVVPYVRSPQFAEQAHHRSLAVASSQHEADDQAFIDALADDE